ncbi:4Fe-4S binding protein [Dehalococcoidia bacterium]|nr:4Fe-4S binding protein [Dehalococcoidia bacterium]
MNNKYKVHPPKFSSPAKISKRNLGGQERKLWRVNKEICVGCGACVAVCPEGMELKEDGKAEVIDSEKLEKCGGKNVCPMGAIERD